MNTDLEKINNEYQNLGIVQTWISTVVPKLSPIDRVVLLELAEQSVGHSRETTHRPWEEGPDYNSKKWSDSLGIAKSTFLKSLKSLVALELIKVHKGASYRVDGGSYPDYYEIVFDKELFIKNKWFIYTDENQKTNKGQVMTREKLIGLIIESARESIDIDDFISAYLGNYRLNLESESNEELISIANSYSISDDDEEGIVIIK